VGWRFKKKKNEGAVRKFQDNQDGIDLVVLDFIMPKMGGKEVAVQS